MNEEVYELTLWEEIWKYLNDNYFGAEVGNNYAYLRFNNSTGTTVFSIIMGLCIGMMIASILIYREQSHIGRFVRRLLKKGADTPDNALSLEELELSRSHPLRGALKRPTTVRKLVNIVAGDRILIHDRYVSEITPEMEEAERNRTERNRSRAKREALEKEAETRRILQEKTAERSQEAPADPQTTSPVEELTSTAAEVPPSPTPTEPAIKHPLFSPEWRAARRERNKDAHLPVFDMDTARFYIPEELRYRAEIRYEHDKFSALSLAISLVVFIAFGFVLVRFLPFFLGLLDSSIGAIIG